MPKNQENDISVQAKRIIDIFSSYLYKRIPKKEETKNEEEQQEILFSCGLFC